MHSSVAFNKMPSFHLNSFCVCFFTFSNVCFVLFHLLSFPPFLWKEKHTHFYQKPWKKKFIFYFLYLVVSCQVWNIFMIDFYSVSTYYTYKQTQTHQLSRYFLIGSVCLIYVNHGVHASLWNFWLTKIPFAIKLSMAVHHLLMESLLQILGCYLPQCSILFLDSIQKIYLVIIFCVLHQVWKSLPLNLHTFCYACYCLFPIPALMPSWIIWDEARSFDSDFAMCSSTHSLLKKRKKVQCWVSSGVALFFSLTTSLTVIIEHPIPGNYLCKLSLTLQERQTHKSCWSH